MNRETAKQQLEAALRQYKHNDSSGGLVFAYELSRTEVLVETLLHELEQEHSTRIDLCTDHGDALATLDDETFLRLIRESGVKGQTFARAKDGIELDYPKAEIERFAEAVRHLTASGVPEKTKEEQAKWLVDAVATASQHPALNESSFYYDRVLAEAIFNNGKALASAPAVCEWTHDDEGVYESACGESWVSPEGLSPDEISSVKYCHGCGRRILIAAAPQRGGE